MKHKIKAINLSLTNRCNANCIYCPINKADDTVPKVDMEFNTVKKVIDETRNMDLTHYSLAMFGESTLSPAVLMATARYIKVKSKAKIQLYTNGIGMNDTFIEYLLRSGIDRFVFSIDGADREKYKTIKGVDEYDTVRENIRKMYNMRIGNHPIISIKTPALYNEEEAEVFKANWDGMCDTITIGTYIDWAGEVEWLSNTISKKEPNIEPCAYVFNNLWIASNGDAVICCIDYKHSIILGNVKTDSVKDILDGDAYRRIMEYHMSGDFNNLPICKNCSNHIPYRG